MELTIFKVLQKLYDSMIFFFLIAICSYARFTKVIFYVAFFEQSTSFTVLAADCSLLFSLSYTSGVRRTVN